MAISNHATLLAIEGMTCEHCVARVSDALQAVDPSATAPRVDLDSASALVEGSEDARALVEAVREAGYEARPVGGYQVGIAGMHCSACATRVSTALALCDRVDDVRVEVDAGRANVDGSPHPEDVRRAVLDAGYSVTAIAAGTSVPASTQHPDEPQSAVATPSASVAGQRLTIEGMTCASCVRSVETALGDVPGVVSVTVNYADSSATVEGPDVSAAALVDAVQQAGYGASAGEDASAPGSHSMGADLRMAAVPLVLGVLLMGGMHANLLPDVGQSVFWIGVALATAGAMAFSGGHFFRAAAAAVKRGSATMDTLIVLGTGTAWLYSTAVVVAPSLFPEAARHFYFEAALFVIGFVSLGRALENRARGKTRDAIGKLLERQPEIALRVDGDEETRVPVAELAPGDVIRIRPGESVPIDATVVEGASSVDESMLTGESDPVAKAAGDTIVGGTLNHAGTLLARVTATGEATVLARIVRRINDAQNSKPRIGRLADDVAAVFVPVVLLVAVLTLIAWWWFGPEPKLNYMLITATSVLIIACPCALGLATPLSIMLGTGRAARAGILIANGEALQAAGRLTTIVLDKTGTLTRGEPEVVKFAANDEARALSLALSLEQLSEHPLARAIQKFAAEHRAPVLPIDGFEATPGGGVRGSLGGTEVALGRLGWLREIGVDTSSPPDNCSVFLAEGGVLKAGFETQDAIRETTPDALVALRQNGLKILMLSGDTEDNARRVAETLGIDHVASADPESKLATVRALQAKGERVGMVGDGINDSLALSSADVGFAMGGGTAVALESADVALLRDELAGVGDAIVASRKTMRNVKQNLAAAFAYNVLLIPVAAGLLYPFGGVLIHPALAGAAMALSSITVVANALRLERM